MAMRLQLRGLSRLNPTLAKPCSVFSRSFAEAAEDQTQPRDVVKEKFMEKIKQYYGLLTEFKKFRIVIDPDDPKAVKDFAQNVFKAYENVGIPPIVDQVDKIVTSFVAKSKSVREYYERLGRFQTERGYTDGSSNKLMLEAVDKVESQIGKTLVRTDKEGMAMFMTETDAVFQKLGIEDCQLATYVEQAQVEYAKGLLAEMKSKATETMEAYKKRDGILDVDVNTRELDIREAIRA